MDSKELVVKLENLQGILTPVIQKLKDGIPLAPEDISKEVIRALQAIGGDAYKILASDFGVFNLGRSEELHVCSEWAYRLDREDLLSHR